MNNFSYNVFEIEGYFGYEIIRNNRLFVKQLISPHNEVQMSESVAHAIVELLMEKLNNGVLPMITTEEENLILSESLNGDIAEDVGEINV